MTEVELALVNNTRVTLRVGDVFLKVDADPRRASREIEALRLAPVPTPEILWHRAPVLALSRVRGSTLGRLGEPPTASSAAWIAVGRVLRDLHDAPLAPRDATPLPEVEQQLDRECRWLVSSGSLPGRVVQTCRAVAEAALQAREPVFIHGDLHLEHVFVEVDAVDRRSGLGVGAELLDQPAEMNRRCHVVSVRVPGPTAQGDASRDAHEICQVGWVRPESAG